MVLENKIKKNQSLAPLTTFKIGGRAEFFLAAKTGAELLAGAAWARRKKLPLRWFGGASNLLVKDGLIRGLTIKLAPGKIKISGHNLSGDAGATLAQALKRARERGLAGLEWAAGLPGSLGGAVRGNAGAFGQEMKQLVLSVEALDLDKMKLVRFNRRQCAFAYRDSKFKQTDRLIISRLELKLKPASPAAVGRRLEANLSYRLAHQPKLPSAGSVFKNLALSELKKQNRALAVLAVKADKVVNGKVPAGWLIERLGLKGMTRGGAKISEQHANFIVNDGRADFKDVKELITEIKRRAKRELKVILEEEIQYFGD